MAREQANSIKFSTIIFIILGLIVPLWPLTLPFFWWLAYRSYKKGYADGAMDDLKNAKDLLDSEAISQKEFETIKARALGR